MKGRIFYETNVEVQLNFSDHLWTKGNTYNTETILTYHTITSDLPAHYKPYVHLDIKYSLQILLKNGGCVQHVPRMEDHAA